MKVEFFRHNVGDEEVRAVARVVRSLFLTTGAEVERFEKALARYVGARDSVGLMSCTHALHLSLLAAGVGPGDEVITTPLSFVATANAIAMAGATPVFADVEPTTGNIDAERIKEAITPRTKAILPVHLYGQMVDMRRISAIAKRYKLAVIEDAAHALESERDGIRPGEQSLGACFSFYATKSITSGEGGAFATNDTQIARRMRQLRSHGITSEVAQRHRTGLTTYDIDTLGWKCNMDNIKAAFLLPQLRKVERQWRARAAVAKRYRTAFARAGINMPSMISGAKHAHHLFTIWVDSEKRNAIIASLRRADIGVTINYPPIHFFTWYRKTFGTREGMFPVAELIARRTISLPLYSSLTKKETDYVIAQVLSAVEKT